MKNKTIKEADNLFTLLAIAGLLATLTYGLMV
jgi:hypothetical protein